MIGFAMPDTRPVIMWHRLALSVVASSLLLATAASAERLPISVYTAASGLPHDRVKCLVRDSRGFLWFCTAGGLSRFDGDRFVNYGVAQGLSHPSINDLIEGPDGTYWVATNGGGVCRFQPHTRGPAQTGADARRLFFTCFVVGDGFANRVNAVAIDRRGWVWAGTDVGLFHLDPASPSAGFSPDRTLSRSSVWCFAIDSSGGIWVGSDRGLARYRADGVVDSYDVNPGHPGTVWGLMFDRNGRLWIGHSGGVLVVRPLAAGDGDPQPPLWRSLVRSPDSQAGHSIALPEKPGDARALLAADGLALQNPGTFLEAADGHVWIASDLWAHGVPGVLEFDGRLLRRYSTEHGLSADPIIAIAEDRDRNVWLGTLSGGAMRLARNGLVAYGERDGLAPSRVQAIIAGPDLEMYVIATGPKIYRFDGARFTGVRPNIGSAQSSDFFQAPLIGAGGEWWVPTAQGLYRFPRVARLEDLGAVRPTAVYGVAHGLPGVNVVSPFEDARGDVWFGVMGSDAVVRWERASARFHVYGEGDGLSRRGPPAGFVEDRAGNLWIGFRRGAVARFRRGRFEMFLASDGVPSGEIATLHVDAAGRLWIGARDAALAYRTAAGSSEQLPGSGEAELARLDEPAADRPRFFLYPPELLSGQGVRTIAEDRSGALYIGGDQGVQRFDPATGSIRRYTVGDGLPSGDVEAAFVDAEGRLWFGTWHGAARLVSGEADAVSPPAVLIGQLRVRGVPQPIAELGEREISGLEVEPDQNQFEIEFFAIAFGGGPPRFQYRLDGVDSEWGPATQERRVTYASLSPGRYRFLVRSITTGGVVAEPATIAFVIRRPVWQRPWFLTVAAVAALLLVSGAHRARVARLLAVERMRTRIATDLHDDIGASLSQIAVLSEATRQRHPGDSELGEALGRIATTSREAVEAMGDIVWAINPRRDSLIELVQRMRRFASDVLAGCGIEFTFQGPADTARLGADVRRHMFLIFKESINNLARHSGAAHAAIEVSLHGGRLTLQVIDDGRGFDSTVGHAGHGLASMQARAHAIGGTLEISAATGGGTRLRLEVPLGRWPGR